jgi:outer membrane murein-binding lipoprotein Lpp
LPNEPNPKIKAALLTAARRQAELDDALADLEDVLKEVAPNNPLASDVFTLNEKIDKILIDIADKYNVDIPDPQDERAT